jgi:antitoxin (DNA-binding transcriptional repressor) of toxin-antitoxin stability system
MSVEWLEPAPSYWLPEHFVYSAWIEHAPFAFAMMDMLRPESVVELGTHNGFSFFVFAEAAKRLRLSTRLSAVDSWLGDDHAGFYGPDILEAVRKIRDSDYPSNATLIQGYFSNVIDQFEDGSVDLLHIDGRHAYEDVREDFELYFPKLSQRAVVLFHDTFEFENGFGVHRFWDELSGEHPSFNFEHGHGLGVLGIGGSLPVAVSDFFEAAGASPDEMRKRYARLGARVGVWGDLRNRNAELVQRVTEFQATVDGQSVELANRTKTIAEIRASSSWRITSPLRGVSRVVRRGA